MSHYFMWEISKLDTDNREREGDRGREGDRKKGGKGKRGGQGKDERDSVRGK